MSITINTEPIDVTIAETTFNLQRDPSATKEWDRLMKLQVTYSDPKKRDTALKGLIEVLVSFAETPEDAEIIRGLDTAKIGPATLNRVSMEYAKEVTGFPTQPSSTSTKRSTATSGT